MQQTFTPDQIDAHRLLVHLESGRATTAYRNNEKIYTQGKEANFVYFVQEGRVELTVRSFEHGPDVPLGTANEGQFFGEACLHKVPVRIATATSVGNSRITSITREAVLSAMQEQPKGAKQFIEYMMKHNSWVDKYLLDHLLDEVAEAA